MMDDDFNRFVPIDKVDPDIRDLIGNYIWKIPWLALYHSCAGHTDSEDIDVWGTSFVIKFSLLKPDKIDDLYNMMFELKNELIKISPKLSKKLECSIDPFSGRSRSFIIEFKYDTIGQKKAFIKVFTAVLTALQQ